MNSNITNGEILEVLSATKTAVVDEYSQGSDATYVQDPATGKWAVDPGVVTITVTGTI